MANELPENVQVLESRIFILNIIDEDLITYSTIPAGRKWYINNPRFEVYETIQQLEARVDAIKGLGYYQEHPIPASMLT